MAEYIDRNAVINAISREMDMQDLYLPVHFLDVLNDVPAADVVEVVRCKDCIYSRFDLDMSEKAAPWLLCKNLRDEMFPLMVAKTDYCCWAERKEG